MPISKIGSKGVKDAEISAADIAPGTISSDKIAPGTIAADRLAGSIPNSKLSNSNITINGTAINLGASGSIVAGIDWQSVKTSNFTAVASEGYFVNTSGGAITVTLPASPSVGDEIHIRDYAETFGTNNVTLNRNGSNIGGIANNGTIDTNKSMTTLVYADATKGWLATENEAKTNVVPPAYVAATGGTVATSGNFKIHTFNSSSNFVVSDAGNDLGSDKVSYLVVAGGGGGGGDNLGGGGGAGGFREGKAPAYDSYTASPKVAPDGLPVSAQTYPITVGAGGAAQSNGSNSVFSTITSTAGGSGGRGPLGAGGQPGGSGGGGYASATGGSGNTPPVSPGQGNNGGDGHPTENSGGGGGAIAEGIDGNSAAPGGDGGNGGNGATTHITGSPITKAGGGGGGAYYGSGGEAGTGGGGNAGAPSGGSNGTQYPGHAASANSGSGGGGSSWYGSGGASGGAGGSGIVVIRYKFQN